MLTQKQINFCTEYLQLNNASEAYRKAYNAENMKDATITNNAYKLLQNNEIRAMIEDMRARTISPVVLTIQQRKEYLTTLIQSADANLALRAIDLLNKMEGVYNQKQEADTREYQAPIINIVLDKSNGEC